ncbi:hypothetical protein FXO38_15859 [Capsicum annuum]|nr:hypothetical protein FXO38_15859 [Capsicum annuum]
MWNSKRLESNLSSCLDSISGSTTLIRYTFDEIKAVTKNFSWVNIVETGWFGNLYKGVFPNGIEVALKRGIAKQRVNLHARELVNNFIMCGALIDDLVPDIVEKEAMNKDDVDFWGL